MPATAMFSKFKSGGGGQTPLETNPICQFFEIGKQTASAGPELVWKIHDAYRKSDGKVSFKTNTLLLVLLASLKDQSPIHKTIENSPKILKNDKFLLHIFLNVSST